MPRTAGRRGHRSHDVGDQRSPPVHRMPPVACELRASPGTRTCLARAGPGAEGEVDMTASSRGSRRKTRAGQPPAGPASAVWRTWPLVGRGDEVAFAWDALGRRGAVVLAGSAGVGKTRLAQEVLAAAEAAGAPTSWVAATRSAGTVPLGAFAHLVPPEVAVVREGQDGRAATLDAVVRALRHHARSGPMVVGVDDAHLLDDASATLVHLLVNGGTARVVATVRSGEPTPDPVVALWKDELALRIEVQPLSGAEVAQLLAETLGGTVDGATARRLFEVTRGNVLFLRELVANGLSSGALVENAGVWSWEGRLRPGVRLRDLVAERVGALDGP